MTKLWSHRIAQSSTSTPDELAALSRRYGNATILLLPLGNGKLAVFARDYQLREIVDEAPTVDQLESWSRQFEQELHAHTVHAHRLHEMGMHEANDRELARNLRSARMAKPVQHFDDDVTLDDLE
jgi:hypothetical protein